MTQLEYKVKIDHLWVNLDFNQNKQMYNSFTGRIIVTTGKDFFRLYGHKTEIIDLMNANMKCKVSIEI